MVNSYERVTSATPGRPDNTRRRFHAQQPKLKLALKIIWGDFWPPPVPTGRTPRRRSNRRVL